MKPKWFEKYVKVYIKKEENRAREMDMNNFNLGKYIMYAFNAPKKYPSKPILYKEQNTEVVDIEKAMTSEEMDKMMRYNTIKLGGTIDGRSK